MARSDNSRSGQPRTSNNTTLTPMQRRVRRQWGRGCCCGPERACAVFEFRPDVLLAKVEELRQCLLRVCVCDAFDKLVNSADGIQPHVVARIVKDHVKDHIVKAIRKVNADLAASTGDSIDNLH